MKKLDWFILIIVIIAIAVGVWVFMFSSEESAKNEERKESKLESLSNRLKAIQQQINDEIESLRLTTEMEQFLDRKIGRIFLIAKIIFMSVIGGIFYLFIVTGSNFLTALSNTTCIVGVILVSVPFLFLSKVIEINTLIESVRSKIKMWIYNKYGFNPTAVSVLKESIEVKTTEANELMVEIRTIN
jgi:hypothetical protein